MQAVTRPVWCVQLSKDEGMGGHFAEITHPALCGLQVRCVQDELLGEGEGYWEREGERGKSRKRGERGERGERGGGGWEQEAREHVVAHKMVQGLT